MIPIQRPSIIAHCSSSNGRLDETFRIAGDFGFLLRELIED